MQTLYDQLLRYQCFRRYDELFITDIVVEEGRFVALVGIHAPSGETVILQAKALLIASGGGGTLYGFTTVLRDRDGRRHGHGLPRRAAARDMEFLQFHPTAWCVGNPDDGRLPGRRRLPEEQQGRAVHGAVRASKMELAPRDMVSRAEMTEILEGRGFPGPDGKDYLHLDLTHLGADVINTRLPLIREVCIKFVDIDSHREAHPHPAGGALLDGRHRDRHQRTDAG